MSVEDDAVRGAGEASPFGPVARSLRGRLLLALSPLAVALTILGAVSLWTVGRLGGGTQVILKDNYRSVLAAQRMKEALERLDSAALFRLAARPEQAGPLVAPNRQRFAAELEIQERNITEPGEAAATRRLRLAWDHYQARYEAFLGTADAEAARDRYFAELQPDFQEIKAAADEVLGLNQDAMVRKSDHAGRLAEQMSGLTAGTTLAALLVGLLLSVTWTSRLLRPLGVLTQAVRRLGEGDLEARAAVSGDDEIAALGREFNNMAAHLGQYRRSSLGELLQAQQASQSAIDSLPDPVIILDATGTLVNVNRAAEDVLGLGLGDAGDPIATLDPALREVLVRVRGHVLGGKGPYQPRGFEEAVAVPGAGGELSLLARATPVYDDQGAISGATVILQDVTRLRRFDELKNDLVATVAHEFRTPLTSLHMAIHLCLEEAAGPLTEKQGDLLYAARQDCERLQGIVNELLDLARIQSGRIELDLRPVDCLALCDAAVDAHRAAAEERGVALRAEVLPGLPEVLADRERLHLVLSNLIVNALRHTPRGGGVMLRAEAAGALVRLSVSDTGEGIAREHLGRIFERFYRVPGAAHGGAGLGLALCKEIVLAHRGEMGVESEPGQGSSFWLTIPAAELKTTDGWAL